MGNLNSIIVSIVCHVHTDIHFGTLIIYTSTLFSSNIIIIFPFYFDLGLVKSRTNIKHNYFHKGTLFVIFLL